MKWGCQDVSVDLIAFSFRNGDVAEMMQRLADAQIFVMAGVFTVDDAWRQRTSKGSEAWPLVEELRARVQYNNLIYVGVCGGALLAGNYNPYDLEPFDLFQGMVVRYGANISSRAAIVTDNASEIQITSGCGAAFHYWHNIRMATVFPVVKNYSQWWEFAERSSQRLSEALTHNVNNPQ